MELSPPEKTAKGRRDCLGFSSLKKKKQRLVMLGRSHNIESLLHREQNLVADIFSILTVTTAFEAIISYVLKFIENLLNIDNELDDEDITIKKVIGLFC